MGSSQGVDSGSGLARKALVAIEGFPGGWLPGAGARVSGALWGRSANLGPAPNQR